MIPRSSGLKLGRKQLARRVSAVGACLIAALAVVGCNRDAEEPMTPASRPATVDNERGIFALVAERCDREARCGNVGPREDYTSRDDCMKRIGRATRDDLNPNECPGGIEQRELDDCLAQVRSEDCGHVFDKLDRLVECRDAELCLD